MTELAHSDENSTIYDVVQATRARLREKHPHGYDLSILAHEVWPQLDAAKKVRALESLFVTYVLRLHDEERHKQLNRDTVVGLTHLRDGDIQILEDAVSSAGHITPDTEVDGVCASALRNVLAELALLQHRVGRQA
ncbi:hypothetical protein [Streptomyces lincolnensis]|uniref:hypothetical protein n=1 Tax=Streptomyces lincolnensis TaxID=1915 RepID=UPI0037D0390D